MAVEVVATDLGSLPEGGFEEHTPIFRSSEGFLGVEAPDAHSYVDLSFGNKFAFQVDGVISSKESERLMIFTEEMGFRDAAPGIQTPPGMRQNTTVHWMVHPRDADLLYSRIAPFVPNVLEGRDCMHKLSHRFNTYRYKPGQQFRPHLDGDWPGYYVSPKSQQLEYWKTGRSMLSMLLYLNGQEQGVEGGDTLLLEKGTVVQRIKPHCGRALFFRHGIHPMSVLHAGDILGNGAAKYVIRINVMYQSAAID
tara:strand:+ start:44 stop:796 length:753 start_codon:yes stop_codon:yes gene_type:complete